MPRKILKRYACWLIIPPIVLMSAVSGRAELANQKETLRGHRNVFVSVTIPENAEAKAQLGLVRESLQRFILERLRSVNLNASTEFLDQTLVLEINIDIHKVSIASSDPIFAFVSQFEASQAAKLAANRQSALAVTWKSIRFGAVTKAQAGLLRDSVIANVDQFIVDWQAAQQPADTP